MWGVGRNVGFVCIGGGGGGVRFVVPHRYHGISVVVSIYLSIYLFAGFMVEDPSSKMDNQIDH